MVLFFFFSIDKTAVYVYNCIQMYKGGLNYA